MSNLESRQRIGILALLGCAVVCSALAADLPGSRVIGGTTGGPIRLAIGGFTTSSDPQTFRKQNILLIDALTARLSQSGHLELVERQAIDSVVGEIALSLSQISKPADAIKAGKLLRADWLLLGSLLTDAGTNTLIARLVDARTGIIRDLAAIPLTGTNLLATADRVTEFVTNSLGRTSSAQQRVFIAVGGFEDLSINNRYPDFRKNLRAAFESAYQGTRFSVLERTMVNPLLTELRLNLGGLTQNPAGGPSAQPAFLLVDGSYQSYQDEKSKINLILRVQEIGGRQRLYSLKEPPGKELDDKIITILNQALNELRGQSSQVSRQTEAATQFARGVERSRILDSGGNHYFLGGYRLEPDKRMRNITEAIDAFQAALLLDPDNAQAKFYLAVCLLDRDVEKKEAGRDYLGEVIAVSTNSSLVTEARSKLAQSYLEEDDRHALDLVLAQARDATNIADRAEILHNSFGPIENLRRQHQLSAADCLALYEQAFLADCASAGAGNFILRLQRDPNSTINTLGCFDDRHLGTLLPQVVKQYPGLAPFIWTSLALRKSNATNPLPAPAILDHFREALEFCRDHPEQVPQIVWFYKAYLYPARNWSASHGQVAAEKIANDIIPQAIDRDAAEGGKIQVYWMNSSMTAIRDLFPRTSTNKSASMGPPTMPVSNVPIGTTGGNPAIIQGRVGNNMTIILPPAMAQHQQPLPPGLPAMAVANANFRPRQLQPSTPVAFTLGEPVLTVGRRMFFACDGDQIWLTDGFVPLRYDKQTKSLDELEWPNTIERYVKFIRVEADRVWWGTDGSGLIEMDKRTGRTKIHALEDGLLLPNITALNWGADRLWIGFGHNDVGGVGYLDLRTRRFVGMTPELGKDVVGSQRRIPESHYDRAPPDYVRAVCQSSANDVWVCSDEMGLQHYSISDNQWSRVYQLLRFTSCMAANSDYLVLGGTSPMGALAILPMAGGRSALINFDQWLKPERVEPNYLPHPCVVLAAAMDHDHLWVGGLGFLALVDLQSQSVQKICDFDDRHVHVQCLQIQGNDLWVAVGNKLYRLPVAGP